MDESISGEQIGMFINKLIEGELAFVNGDKVSLFKNWLVEQKINLGDKS